MIVAAGRFFPGPRALNCARLGRYRGTTLRRSVVAGARAWRRRGLRVLRGGPGRGGAARGLSPAVRELYGEGWWPARAVLGADRGRGERVDPGHGRGEHGPGRAPRPRLGGRHPAHR